MVRHDEHLVAAGLLIVVPVRCESKVAIGSGAVVLPLVVERVVIELEVHGPVIDIVRPPPDLFADFIRDQLGTGNDEILELQPCFLPLGFGLDF
jgi:hypothetical protein